MHAVAHSMPIGHFFNTEHRIDTFDGETSMRDVLEYFSACAADAVIITEEALWAGIVTVKDIIKGLHNWDNLLLPIRNFMTAPLQTFNETQSVAEVLEVVRKSSYNKIIVTRENELLGMMDRHHLLSLCYDQITPLIKHEYSMIHSMLGLVGDGEKGLLELATTDSLTGIGNRRLLEEVFQAHQALGDRYEIPLYLILFDIDDFKSINDTFGHNIGDSVLKKMVSLVSQSIRKSDVFVRWGGEEFAILVRSSEFQNVVEIAEQIRKRIDMHSFDSIIHVTCSFGVTPVRVNETINEAFERADTALYRAKDDGKNTIRMIK